MITTRPKAPPRAATTRQSWTITYLLTAPALILGYLGCKHIAFAILVIAPLPPLLRPGAARSAAHILWRLAIATIAGTLPFVLLELPPALFTFGALEVNAWSLAAMIAYYLGIWYFGLFRAAGKWAFPETHN